MCKLNNIRENHVKSPNWVIGPGLGQSQARPSQLFGFWPGLWFYKAWAVKSQAKAGDFRPSRSRHITMNGQILLLWYEGCSVVLFINCPLRTKESNKLDICNKFNIGTCKNSDSSCKYCHLFKNCGKLGHKRKNCNNRGVWNKWSSIEVSLSYFMGRRIIPFTHDSWMVRTSV
jgi:hypothetical protein